MSNHYDDLSYQERMEAQHGHPGDVALASDTIPKEAVAAALKAIEDEVRDHRYCFSRITCLRRTLDVIAAQRRELGLEEVNNE